VHQKDAWRTLAAVTDTDAVDAVGSAVVDVDIGVDAAAAGKKSGVE
jgi:hypothetical protein